jgi:hypothetical protein
MAITNQAIRQTWGAVCLVNLNGGEKTFRGAYGNYNENESLIDIGHSIFNP